MDSQDKQQLIIGLGTGRSGTRSLSAFLSGQRGVCVLHEGRMTDNREPHLFRWSGEEEAVLDWLDELLRTHPEHRHAGDVGMYYLEYAGTIIRRFPTVRFICMQRDKKAVVRSYLMKTPGSNHWMDHDGRRWSIDAKWDKAYPKFSAGSKKNAIEQYWEYYAARVQHMSALYPGRFLTVQLANFDNPDCREAILDFIGYTGPRNIQSEYVMNAGRWRRSYFKRMRRAFWRTKRYIFGSPESRY